MTTNKGDCKMTKQEINERMNNRARELAQNELKYKSKWDELKQSGSEHYRGVAQPIDIYKAKGIFKSFALASICKYSVRNMDKELNPKDMTKIIHYAELILAENEENDKKNLNDLWSNSNKF